jgi:hypothetical protein
VVMAEGWWQGTIEEKQPLGFDMARRCRGLEPHYFVFSGGLFAALGLGLRAAVSSA